MRRHAVGELRARDVPVAAVGVAARVVVRLPAVVEDDRLHAVLGGLGAFGLDDVGTDVLVEGVPRRVEGLEGGGRRFARRVAGTCREPGARLADGFREGARARIEANLRLVVREGRLGCVEEAERPADFVGMLAERRPHVEDARRLGADHGEAVFVVRRDERLDGHVGGDAGAHARAAVPRDGHVAACRMRVPDLANVALRHGEGDLELRREGFLRRVERDADDLGLAGFDGEREAPRAGFGAGEDDLADGRGGCRELAHGRRDGYRMEMSVGLRTRTRRTPFA